jgi:hypothetical protein
LRRQFPVRVEQEAFGDPVDHSSVLFPQMNRLLGGVQDLHSPFVLTGFYLKKFPNGDFAGRRHATTTQAGSGRDDLS